MKNKTVCFIPARSGSKGIKNKNLRRIKNLTLLDIAIKCALDSKIFNRIILSSDSNKILKYGKKYNIDIFKRSSKNSKDNSKTDSALLEVMKKINFEYDNIVILQVTSPLRRVQTIKNFVNYCERKKIKTCCTVSILEDQISLEGRFFNPIFNNKHSRLRQIRKKFLVENGLLYFIQKKFFEKEKKIFPQKNWNYYITDKYESIDINDINDLKICAKLFQQGNKKN